MTKRSTSRPRARTSSLKVERVFDASPETLWTYWTDPAKFARWFNPAPGIDLVIHEYEVRPGGRIRFDMPQPDGNRNPQEGVFHVLEPYREIVSGAQDRSFLISVRFESAGKRTRMTVTVTGVPPEVREGARNGWSAGFDKLEKALTGPRPDAANGPEIVITRVLGAPRERVWRAWTDPEQVRRWWGPRPFTSPSCSIDLRVGGTYLFCMRSPEGKDFWSTGVYREVDPPERLVFTDSFADETGKVVPATHYGLGPEIPLEMIVTVTFEDLGGKTKMTLRHAGMAGEHGRMAEAGWATSLDKLQEWVEDPLEVALPTDREIVMTRVFHAPRERVFRAYTDPKAIPQWWGPREYATTVEAMDVRPGGAWRFLQTGPDGRTHGFHGVYREVTPPERLVETFEYEGTPGHEVVDTVTFAALPGGRTRVTVRSTFASTEDREGMLESGMEAGARESMDRLEELLARGARGR